MQLGLARLCCRKLLPEALRVPLSQDHPIPRRRKLPLYSYICLRLASERPCPGSDSEEFGASEHNTGTRCPLTRIGRSVVANRVLESEHELAYFCRPSAFR